MPLGWSRPVDGGVWPAPSLGPQAGRGPVERRTTSWVGSTRVGGSVDAGRAPARDQASTARAPASSVRSASVVSGGLAEVGAEDVVEADHADVAGHRDAALGEAGSITPIASMSLCATTAVARAASDGVGRGRPAAEGRRVGAEPGRPQPARLGGRAAARPSGGRPTRTRAGRRGRRTTGARARPGGRRSAGCRCRSRRPRWRARASARLTSAIGFSAGGPAQRRRRAAGRRSARTRRRPARAGGPAAPRWPGSPGCRRARGSARPRRRPARRP